MPLQLLQDELTTEDLADILARLLVLPRGFLAQEVLQRWGQIKLDGHQLISVPSHDTSSEAHAASGRCPGGCSPICLLLSHPVCEVLMPEPLAIGVCSWSLQVTSVPELRRLLDELGVNVIQIACG